LLHLAGLFNHAEFEGSLAQLTHKVLDHSVFKGVLLEISFETLSQYFLAVEENCLVQPTRTFPIADSIEDIFSVSSRVAISCDGMGSI